MDVLFLIVLAIVGLIALTLVLGSFFTVSTAQVAVVTRFGKFLRTAEPGLNWKMPYFDSVAGIVSLRVNQISLTMETKTKDNVFVTIPISVQNRVRPERSMTLTTNSPTPWRRSSPTSSRSSSATCPA